MFIQFLPPKSMTINVDPGVNGTMSTFPSLIWRHNFCSFVNNAAASGSKARVRDSLGIPAYKIGKSWYSMIDWFILLVFF